MLLLILITVSRFPPTNFHDKVLTSMHSVGLEPTKLILVGTRTTYEATGGVGYLPGDDCLQSGTWYIPGTWYATDKVSVRLY